MNELVINEKLLKVTPGTIEFPEYEKLQNDANNLAEALKTVKVTPETLSVNKKLLANLNKEINKVETFRKSAHKIIEEPYKELKSKTDAILAPIAEASLLIKSQERELEEEQRQHKKDDVKALYVQRLNLYPNFPFKFKDFLDAQSNVLNKSVSMNQVEELMATWFDQKQKDIDVIKKMDDANDILAQYIMVPESVTEAISVIQKKKEYLQKAAELAHKEPEPDFENYTKDVPKPFTFVLYGDSEASKVRSYMIANHIEYKEI